VSLYSPVGAGAGRGDVQARVSSLLHQIKPLAKHGSLGHEARMSLRTDIERMEKALAEEHWPPGAIAILSCARRDLYEEVPLPRRVRDRVIVDATSFARPMLAVLDEYHRSCVPVIDKGSARIWEIYLDMREVGTFSGRMLRKPNYAAGLAEDRVRNKADELSKRHYRRVAEVLDELFRADRYDLLIVGGHDYELPQFLEFLPRDLRGRVAGTFCTDPATAPVAEIRCRGAPAFPPATGLTSRVTATEGRFHEQPDHRGERRNHRCRWGPDSQPARFRRDADHWPGYLG
jgi:peptide chain release factor subunit 1